MKKLFALIMSALLLGTAALSAGAVGDTNNLISEAGTYEYPAGSINDIMSGTAEGGEIDAILPPSLDGQIADDEYVEMPRGDFSSLLGVFAYSDATSEEDLKAFAAAAETVIPYWGAGWDGTYLYMAFTVNTADITFYNGLTKEDVYLFAHTCFQIGVANPDATGNRYSETGWGISTADDHVGDPITYSWSGTFSPDSATDFGCSYDPVNNKAVYEMRIKLTDALGAVAHTGDNIKLAWCYMMGTGQTSAGETNYSKAIMYAHGITGRFSGKRCEYFANFKLTGNPSTVGELVEKTEEQLQEEEYGIKETISFASETVQQDFASADAKITGTPMTEGDIAFMRYVSTAADSFLTGEKYPKLVNADLTKYIAIRYRTTSEKAVSLGITYANTFNGMEVGMEMWDDVMYNDGQWRTLIIDLSVDPSWTAFPKEFTLMLPEGTVDIRWIKFFTDDIIALYDEDIPAGSQTEAPTDAPATEAPTQAPTTDAPATEPPATQAATNGCGSVISTTAAFSSLILLGAAYVARKKKD